MCRLVILFSLLILSSACTYSFTSVRDQPIDECSPQVILEEAKEAFQAGEYDWAAHIAAYIPEEHPDAAEAEEALYVAAESSYREEELREAFGFFKELVSRFPATSYSRLVAERDYAMGCSFFEEGEGFFGIFKTRSYGVKVMNHLMTYFPTSDLADDAQLAIGEYFFSVDDYVAAAESFERIMKEYPTSEWVEKATFMTGLSYYRLNKGPSYDRESLLRSIEFMRFYRDRYSTGNFFEESGEILDDSCERMAAKELEIALYYLDQDQDRGGRIHLANAALLFPETESGQKAQALLTERDWDTTLNTVDTIRSRSHGKRARR